MLVLKQIVVEHDGKLAMVKVEENVQDMVLALIASLSPDGKLQLIRLPDDIKMVPLT
jgi:hypothetical protein